MVRGVVVQQQVIAEVVVRVTPDRMYVVGLASQPRSNLGIFKLHQERRTLDAIVVRLASFWMAGPGERELLESRTFNALQMQARRLLRQAIEVRGDDVAEIRHLARSH